MLRLGLRAKFFLYSNTLIVVTMTIVTVLGIGHERKSRYDAIASRGQSIAASLAVPITDALMYEELGLMNESGLIESYITDMLESNRDLARYVIIHDVKGRITYSSRWELLGKAFPRALDRFSIDLPPGAEVRTLDWGERALEVRMPLHIASRFWGGLAMGFSLEPIEREVAAVGRRAVLVALMLLVGNSVLTALYVEGLIRPILELHRNMKLAGGGDLATRARVQRGDEVGELAEEFNQMMDELKEARTREKAQQAQLAHTEKMVAVGTLAAGVAHEVNNPLGGILTCIESMRSNPHDASLQHRYLGLIHDGIKRIEHTILNLLDFSRPRPMRTEPTSLNHSLRQVAELVSFQLRKNRVEVRLDLEENDPVVVGDHFQMEQLLLNLVLNGIQAMPGGGTLVLRTRHLDGWVAAEVVDTGEGIPKEIHDRIFDPFFTTRGVGEGTGLGLAVSYGIVSAHGGTIEVESAPGRGSTFRVLLPAAGGAGS
jgi:signal transduction histidine kinase